MTTNDAAASVDRVQATKHNRDCKSFICEKIDAKIPIWRDRVGKLLKENGDFVVSEVTIEQLYSGIRGVHIATSDVSYVDPMEGLRVRGYTIPELMEKLPRAEGTETPLVGGVFYLLMASELPTEENALMMEFELKRRQVVPEYVYNLIRTMPRETHPMTLFSQAILALQNESVFAREYSEGIQKPDYWQAYVEDTLNLIAKLPTIAAFIYNWKYRDGQVIEPDPELFWGANFAHMIGKGDSKEYQELCNLHFFLHCDHEGGNVSAHTANLVASALSDIYYACSAGMNGLAGPLHGLANQECLIWLQSVREKFDHFPTAKEIEQFAEETIAAGRVIPGYGHAVLRVTDPRFVAFDEFGQKHAADSDLFRLVHLIYQVVPDVLRKTGKVKNPWPNVDAISGALQYHYGVTEYDFYTVLFGISRCMGLCAHAVWSRALGKPIERPKSLTLKMLEEMVVKEQ